VCLFPCFRDFIPGLEEGEGSFFVHGVPGPQLFFCPPRRKNSFAFFSALSPILFKRYASRVFSR